MPVGATPNEVKYIASGSTATFVVPFYFLVSTDLIVVIDGVQKTFGVHYSVAGAKNPAGGSITLGSMPAIGSEVYIYRAPPLTQTTNVTNSQTLLQEFFNDSLDKLTMITQWLAQRSVLRDPADTGAALAFPALAARGGKMLGFTAAGAMAAYAPGISLPAGEAPDSQVLPLKAARLNALLGFDGSGNVVTYASSAVPAVPATGSDSFVRATLPTIGSGVGFYADEAGASPNRWNLGAARIASGAASEQVTFNFLNQTGPLGASGWNWLARESDWQHYARRGRIAFTAFSKASMDTPTTPGFHGAAAGTITPGAGYTNGTFTNVALTGGSGSGARAAITVAGGVVTAVSISSIGVGYVVGDVLSAALAGGAGFAFTLTGVYSPATIGAASIVDNDRAGPYQRAAWGHYIEAIRRTGAGTTVGLELDIDNGGSLVELDPYNASSGSYTSGLTLGIKLAAGGAHPGQTTDVSAALHIANNGGHFRKGIVFHPYSLANTAGSPVTGDAGTATAPAILAVPGCAFDWWRPNSTLGMRIVSVATDPAATNITTILNDDTGLHLMRNNVDRFIVQDDRCRASNLTGFDNIDLFIMAAGTGSLRLGAGGAANRWLIDGATGHFYPAFDAIFDIGKPAPTPLQIRNLFLSGGIRVGGNAVLGARDTGWGAATGGSKVAFNATTATLPQTAAAVAALIQALTTHGMIGA